MPRGGARPGAGRKKQIRVVDANVAKRIKERIKAEELWVFLVAKATEKATNTGNTSDLRQALEYLDDRDLGKCTQPMEVDGKLNLNLAARRERVRELLTRLAGKS